MATMPLFEQPVSVAVGESAAIITRERQRSLMLRAWIGSGLFFMALPGTLLGFSNLMAISAHHGSGTLPAAWMEGHGHAQMFGWIGSFILGIGFYSSLRMGGQPFVSHSPAMFCGPPALRCAGLEIFMGGTGALFCRFRRGSSCSP